MNSLIKLECVKEHNADVKVEIDNASDCYQYDAIFQTKNIKAIKHETKKEVHTKQEDQDCKFQTYMCELCNCNIGHSQQIKRHMRGHVLTSPPPSKAYKFNCNFCGKKYSCKKTFQAHVWGHTGERPFKCDLCDLAFTRKYSLKCHKIHIHTHGKAFECDVCHKKFKLSTQASMHKKRVHDFPKQYEESPQACETCGKICTSKGNLKYHNLIYHSGDKKYDCDVCEAKFWTSSLLESHKLIHTGHRPHVCPFCDKTFRCKPILTVHIRTHTQEKPYECHVCGKRCSQSIDLKRHVRTHFDFKKYSCDLCNALFVGKSTVRNHLKVHIDRDRKYKCDICPKSFYTSGNLQTHQHVHQISRPYECEICGFAFKSLNKFNIHRRRVHSSTSIYRLSKQCNFSCVLCGSIFGRLKVLSNHLFSHIEGATKFKCEVCQRIFYDKMQLKIHYLSHQMNGPYECSFCELSFNIKDYLRKHLIHHVQLKDTRYFVF